MSPSPKPSAAARGRHDRSGVRTVREAHGVKTSRPWVVCTPSGLEEFERCPRRYRNGHLLQLHGEPRLSSATRTGSHVHALLAAAHAEPDCGTALRELLDADSGAIADPNGQHEGAPGSSSPAEAGSIAPPGVIRSLLQAHIALCPGRSDPPATYLGGETQLFWWDRDHRILFSGKADAIWQTESGIEVRDYKTGSSTPAPLENRTDVAAYAVLAAAAYPGLRPVTVAFEYLAEGELLSAGFDSASFAGALANLRARGLELARANEFPSRPGPHCSLCAFSTSCPDSASG